MGLMINKTVIGNESNPLQGLTLGLGVGILQHSIRLIDDSNNTPQFEGDYAKGYDRSSRGPAFKQLISYQHIGTNKNLNYSLGLSITEAFTKSVRSYNFDTGLATEGSRLDILIGLEATWFLPIKTFDKVDEVFY